MGMPADSVEVAIQDSTAYVKVHGRGTFKIASSLKQFGMAAASQGCSRIVVEMSDCLGMDSTFMGVLAGLAVHLRKKDGELTLRNMSDKNSFLIRMLGLSHLVRTEQAGGGQNMPADAQVLDAGTDKQTLTTTMIDSHETLVQVAPENLPKFKDVLAFLKEDQQRADGQNGVERLP